MRRRGIAAGLILITLAVVGTIAQTTPDEGAAVPEAEGAQTLRLGVAAFYNPRVMYLKYQPLADYLTRRAGRNWELVIGTSYQSAVDDLCNGEVDAAYLGPLTYLRAHELCGAEPLVQLLTRSQSHYRSYILVRNDSAIETVADLRGKRIGFGDRLSTSSNLVPLAMLGDAEVDRDEIECIYFSHHERAVRAVLMGEVHACGVRDVVARRFADRGLRILAQSQDIANFPLAVHPKTSAEIRDLILRALIDMPGSDPEAAREMRLLDEELRSGFRRAVAADFDEVHQLAIRVFGPNVLSLPAAELGCPGGGS